MRIGLTGTREGMTEQQKRSLIQLLAEYRPTEFHHGDCVGADAEAHTIVQQHCTTARIVIHPPTNPAMRAFCHGDAHSRREGLPNAESRHRRCLRFACLRAEKQAGGAKIGDAGERCGMQGRGECLGGVRNRSPKRFPSPEV